MATAKQTSPAKAPKARPQVPPPSGKEIAQHRGDSAVATAQDVANLGEFAGFEHVGKDDVAIPFLTILQPLSPQCTPGHAEYMEGSKPGQILQTVSKELTNDVLCVVADYRRSFIEWVPRDKGGGFRGESGLDAEPLFQQKINRTTGKAKLDNGNDLVDTRSFFVLTSSQTEEGTPNIAPAMLSMASTQTKAAKQWMNLILTYIPPGQKPGRYPPWAAIFRLSTVLQKNDRGSWYGWKVDRVGFNRIPELIEAARQFHQQVRTGAVKVDRSHEVPTEESETGAADGKM